MKFTNISTSQNGNHLKLEIHDIDLSIVNAIRRTILSEIPNIAFKFINSNKENDIQILENTSPIHNEFLAHRISLIPIKLPCHLITQDYVQNLAFEINVNNTSSSKLNVTSKDIHMENTNDDNSVNIADIFPADPITNDHILITILKEYVNTTQSVLIKAKPSIGIPKHSICYASVSHCTFHNVVDENKAQHYYDTHAKEMTLSEFDTLEKFRHFYVNKFNEPNRFHFSLTSESGLSPAYILSKAIKILIQKISEIKLKHESNLLNIQSSDHLYIISINGETHTIGNMLQCLFFNKFVRSSPNTLLYVGYNVPHPLEDYFVLKLKLADTKMHIDTFLSTAFEEIISHLNKLYDLLINEFKEMQLYDFQKCV